MENIENKKMVQNCCCGSANRDTGTCCPDVSLSESGAQRVDGIESPVTVTGMNAALSGTVPAVDTELTFSDRLGAWKVRWGIGRMRYHVKPGLYAVNNPDSQSPVLVTANYKLSFDAVRSQLGGYPSWILVLDTKGVNVWCAAGKGTFGTGELVARIDAVRLSQMVSHRTLVLPQLGASGISAHEVKRLSGFRVVYGPVRARDIPSFLDAGMKATPEMRRVRFTFYDRLVLIPVELVLSLKYVAGAALVFLLLSGLSREGFSVDRAVTDGIYAAMAIFAASLGGTVVTPLLLPWIPGRAFSLKGLWVGLMLAVLISIGFNGFGKGYLTIAAWFLIVPAIVSFLAMNFTGATTFTSLSGVKKEVRLALPIQGTAAALGAVVWIAGRFI